MGLIDHISTNHVSIRQVSILLCCSLFLSFTDAIDNISFNQSVQGLISNDQKFKLEFFSPKNSIYHYVGVLYNVPVITAVWVANRENPLIDFNGTVAISEDGNLVILDGKKRTVWSSNLSISSVSTSAQLLDTGNLVLRDNSKNTIIWESFRHASDSLLPDMTIYTDLSRNDKNVLTSWRSDSDPSPGSFTCTLEPLNIPQLFVFNGTSPNYRSGPWNGKEFTGIPSMKFFYQYGVSIVRDNSRSASVSFTTYNSSLMYFDLSSSGVLRQKMWNGEKGDWDVTSMSNNSDCDVYGKCGPFGICSARGKVISCSCLFGFEPRNIREWNSGNWIGGCTRKAALKCEKNDSIGEKIDGFLRVETVKVPDKLIWVPTNDEAECGVKCLRNCSCLAYAVDDGIGCMMWIDELVDMQKFTEGGLDLYIRLASSEFDNKKDQRAIIATIVVLASSAFCVGAYFLWKLLQRHKGYFKRFLLKDNVDRLKLEELPLYKFEVLSHATNNFDSKNKLGQGGFGPVYRGKLPGGQEIAVKRLSKSSNQGLDEFMNEVKVISKLQHRNLVRLLGCCVACEEKMLVYEYMPNGSLDAYLFDSRRQENLDWQRLVTIVEGICRGLVYLHRDSRLRIIHRDLKASNILLDEEMNPKISDFGTARIFGGIEDQANTNRVVGTFGYIAPEYASHGRFSEKSDVYSFGVLLLEILSGRKNSSFYHDLQHLSLIAYAWKLWQEEDIASLTDRVVYDPRSKSELVRYVNVGLLCVEEMDNNRPNISTVLSMLNCEIAELPRPRQPAFIVNQRSTETECRPNQCSINVVSTTIVEGR